MKGLTCSLALINEPVGRDIEAQTGFGLPGISHEETNVYFLR